MFYHVSRSPNYLRILKVWIQITLKDGQNILSWESGLFSRIHVSSPAERLNNVEPQKMVNSKSIKVPRDRLLRPWFHSPLSRYQSSLMFRKTWEIYYLKKSVKYSIMSSSLQRALVLLVWALAMCSSRKHPYPPPPLVREFFRPFTCLEISFTVKLHIYISLHFFGITDPPTPHPRKFNCPLWMEYGYFLELHNALSAGEEYFSSHETFFCCCSFTVALSLGKFS